MQRTETEVSSEALGADGDVSTIQRVFDALAAAMGPDLALAYKYIEQLKDLSQGIPKRFGSSLRSPRRRLLY